jgi:hypothetical protein
MEEFRSTKPTECVLTGQNVTDVQKLISRIRIVVLKLPNISSVLMGMKSSVKVVKQFLNTEFRWKFDGMNLLPQPLT